MAARCTVRKLLPAALAATLVIYGLAVGADSGAMMDDDDKVLAASFATQLPAVSASTGGCAAPPVLSARAIPSDIAASNSQANVNCLAWQDFIAVNWAASPNGCAADASVPASKFGQPNHVAPVVWETYKKASEVFRAHAAAPAPWCSANGVAGNDAPGENGYKILGVIEPGGTAEFEQANANGAWLTGQNGRLTLYEIRVNQDEFNYIRANRLYSAAEQRAFAEGPGIDLPDG